MAQSIVGSIIDKNSKYPLSNVYVSTQNNDYWAISDSLGNWELNTPLGEYFITFKLQGYKIVVQKDVYIMSGKQSKLQVEMVEDPILLDGITVSSRKIDRTSSISIIPSILSNIPGNANDPVRMVTFLSGVNSVGDDRNDLVVRGNSPVGVLWKIEGIEVFNPNHYASSGGTGGAISTLNLDVIDKSTFYVGAFPSEYGNVYSGVFDVNFRDGNFKKMAYSLDVNNLDINASFETPVIKDKLSILVGLRQSIIPLFDIMNSKYREMLGATPNYSDISFKVVSKIGKAKTTFWGIGGSSNVDLSANTGSNTSPFDIRSKSNTFSSGLSHDFFIGAKLNVKLLTGISNISTNNFQAIKEYASRNKFVDYEKSISLGYKSHYKISPRQSLNTGFMFRGIDTDIRKDNRQYEADASVLAGYKINKKHYSYNSFVNWNYFLKNTEFSLGLHFFAHSLNYHTRLEPRLSIQHTLNNRLRIGMSFGEYSKQNPIGVYLSNVLDFNNRITHTFPNKNLDFIKSRQIVFSINGSLGDNLSFINELYFQHHYDVGIAKEAMNDRQLYSSVLNSSYYFGDISPEGITFENSGKGRNYGIETTLQYKSKDKIFVNLSGTYFDSKFKNKFGWYNTLFNNKYAIKATVGKEFNINKINRIRTDLLITWVGGRRYTPIDFDLSYYNQFVYYKFDELASRQYSDYFRLDFKFSYIFNLLASTHVVSLDFRNLTNNNNIFDQNYYFDEVVKSYRINQLGFFPLLSYKIMFTQRK